MGSNEETNAAGTDTRPPMLVESDYDSWKIRIHRYIRGKPNGKLIWKSIQNGPTPHPMITDPPPTGSTVVPAPRKKLDSEFNEEENKLEMADTQAEIILSQGLPRHIFNILNKTSTAKEIWDNVELLMQGSEHGHFYHELFRKLYPISKHMSPHAKKTLKKQEQSESIVDTLTLLSQPTAQSSNDALMATMTQIANLLSGFQKQFPPTNNQLRTSSNSKSAFVQDGRIVTEPVQGKAPAKDSQYFKDKMLLMEAKEKGASLDAEAKAFLADVNELSREQAYWLPANEIASQASNPDRPVTPFIHTRPPPSQVLANLQKVNAVFSQFEGIIKERTTQKPGLVSELCLVMPKQFDEQQLIFDDLDAEYERCVLDNKDPDQ
ncbi:hypothetical protein Tco_0105218 [Tanacetum coccineum]